MSANANNDKVTEILNSVDAQFRELGGQPFKTAMNQVESLTDSAPLIALLLFHSAISTHPKLADINAIAAFIFVNADTFKPLFQSQIVAEIPSLDGEFKFIQGEILPIIFRNYSGISALISKLSSALSSKKCTDKVIRSLLAKIYPQHYHGQIAPHSSISYLPCDNIKVDGFDIEFYVEDSTAHKDRLTNRLHNTVIALSRPEDYLRLRSEPREVFLNIFKEIPYVKQILDTKSNPESNPESNPVTTTPPFSNPSHSQQVAAELDIRYSPLLQQFGHFSKENETNLDKIKHKQFSFTLSARTDDINPSSLGQTQFEKNVHAISKLLRENILSTSTAMTDGTKKFIIQPLPSEHLVLSWQQVSLDLAIEYIQKKLIHNEQPNLLEDIHFNFVTGMIWQQFIQACQDGKTNNVVVPCFLGSSGFGKSLLLYLHFVEHICKILTQIQTQTLQIPSNSRFRLFTTFHLDSPNPTQIECQIFAQDDQQAIKIFARTSTDMYDAIQPSDIITHYCDPPDSTNSRVHKQPPNANQQSLPPQQPFSPTLPQQPYFQQQIGGVEFQLVSAQELVLNPNTHKLANNRVPAPQPGDSTVVLRRKNRSPLPLQAPPTYRQTTLSLFKSSLYRQYSLSHPNATQEELASFSIELNKLTITDLYNIRLFNEWDNGQSLSTSLSTLIRPNSTDTKIERILSCFQLPTFYDNASIQVHTPRTCESIKRFNDIIIKAFNIISTPNNDEIEQYKTDIFKQLRLLPYISPSMRSAMNLYQQFQDESTAPLNHRDFFVRFIPASFYYIANTINGDQDFQHFTSVTQFSHLLPFTTKTFHESFFSAATFSQIVPRHQIQFQHDFDKIPLSYKKTTLQFYSTTDPVNTLVRKYAPNSTLYRHIVFTNDTPPPTGYDYNTCIESIPQIDDPTISFIAHEVAISPTQLNQKQVPHMNYLIGSAIKFVCSFYQTHRKYMAMTIPTSIATNYPAFDHILISIDTLPNQQLGLTPTIIIIFLQLTTGKKKTIDVKNRFIKHLGDQIKLNSSGLPVQSRYVIVSPEPVNVTISSTVKDPTNYPHWPSNWPFSEPEYVNFSFMELATIHQQYGDPCPIQCIAEQTNQNNNNNNNNNTPE